MLLHRYHHFVLISAIRAVTATMVFINPPEGGPAGDFSSNPTYTLGSTIEISWSDSPADTGVSLLLYQLNATTGDYFLPGQYLFQNSYDVSKYDWIVAFSTDDMPYAFSVSNLFYLSLFEEGQTSADTLSHYLYIKEAETTTTTSSSTSTATSLATAGASLVPTSTAPTASASQPSTSAGALSTGAKVGVGVGIAAAAVMLAFLAGCLIVRRRKARRQVQTGAEPHGSDSHFGVYTDNSGLDARYSGQALGDMTTSGAAIGGKQNWPAIYETSGESRVVQPVEASGESRVVQPVEASGENRVVHPVELDGSGHHT